MKRLLLLLALLTAPLGRPAFAFDAVLTDDTSLLLTGKPSKSGSQPMLTVDAKHNALLKFDLNSLPPGRTSSNVVSATVTVFISRVTKPGAVSLSRILGDWNEEEIPAVSFSNLNGQIAIIGTNAKNNYLRFDVTNLVKSWIDGSVANAGLAIGADGTGPGVVIALDSKENIATGHSTTLHIELVDAGPQGPPGPAAVTWRMSASSTQQMQAGAGYLVTSAQPVVFTLPAASAPGEIVRVTGTGNVGWSIPNAASTIRNVWNYVAFKPHGTSRNWGRIASAADGTKLVASGGGQLFTSSDSGMTWMPRESNRSWSGVASSADGAKLVALADRIYTSIDSGVTWTPRESVRGWQSVASSSDGTKLVAAEWNDLGPPFLYTSTDSGASWTPRSVSNPWLGADVQLASSIGGTRLVAVPSGWQIYTSTDSGVTWIPREIARSWSGITSSSDGTKLAATVSGGQIFTSTDSGTTWIPRASIKGWSAIAGSADGTKLVAAVSGGTLYTSTDSGATWSPSESSRDWRSVASSSDGTKIVASESAGQIYTFNSTTAALTGSSLSSVELQSLGNGQWVITSQVGVTFQ